MYIADRQAVGRQRCLLVGKESDGLFDGKCIFDAEDAAAAALEAVKMCSAAERFAKVACKCAYICTFAAGHAYFSAWTSEG